MTDIKFKIASGLEQAFAEFGFSQPSVEDLRTATGVSLRTLYKYMPSREAMVYAALEHRHQRYIAYVFCDLPTDENLALDVIVDKIAAWMEREASHGCLFHSAVASAPGDAHLKSLLERHKEEFAETAARAAGCLENKTDISLIFEGLTQSWALHGKQYGATIWMRGARQSG